jgi:hypothetical protein
LVFTNKISKIKITNPNRANQNQIQGQRRSFQLKNAAGKEEQFTFQAQYVGINYGMMGGPGIKFSIKDFLRGKSKVSVTDMKFLYDYLVNLSNYHGKTKEEFEKMKAGNFNIPDATLLFEITTP